jgi:hypothetical protein
MLIVPAVAHCHGNKQLTLHTPTGISPVNPTRAVLDEDKAPVVIAPL